MLCERTRMRARLRWTQATNEMPNYITLVVCRFDAKESCSFTSKILIINTFWRTMNCVAHLHWIAHWKIQWNTIESFRWVRNLYNKKDIIIIECIFFVCMFVVSICTMRRHYCYVCRIPDCFLNFRTKHILFNIIVYRQSGAYVKNSVFVSTQFLQWYQINTTSMYRCIAVNMAASGDTIYIVVKLNFVCTFQLNEIEWMQCW